MNDNDVRERVLMKLSEMAEDCETETDIIITYNELRRLLRDYKNDLKNRLKYGKETTENDD